MTDRTEKAILAMDIGGGTQDILIYEAGETPENYIQLVLPSPTVITAQKINKVTQAGKGLHLSGTIMGGGKSVGAIKAHLKAGLPVTAEEEAAQTIKDDLAQVRALGIELANSPPPGFETVTMQDVDLDTLGRALGLYGIRLPRAVAVAVQDHGAAPSGKSNREIRFQHWKNFIEKGGKVRELAYLTAPPYLTRMQAVQKTVPGALVMDTCAAAVWGSFADDKIKERLAQGVVLVNIGNQHTFAVLLQGERIFGLFEHHTRLLDTRKLCAIINKLCRRELTHKEVFDDGGHGCYLDPETPPGFTFVGVTGPRRSLAAGQSFYLVNPHGNMMMTGCFGLVEAARHYGLLCP